MASESPIISSDLERCFAEWRAAHHTALIPYITAGYPRPADTLPLLRALADAGADIIELGVPFSDPVADGPTIQRSSQVALEHGMTLESTLSLVRALRRESDVPVVIFTYLNPILAYGPDRFIDAAVDAGAQGVLIVDLPVGADPELESVLENSPLALIRLLAPTTADARAQEIAERTQGFLYYVARLGVTGARTALRTELLDEVRAVRALSDVPVAVGFGISSAEQARAVAGAADGIVIGSALIDALDRGGIEAAASLLRELREALDH
ncbi:MAG TPA: tryptophan synthase subunit alpha [Longimicrobiales bacterium]|nr:tryptophan synthase subunit alpha [Longimicrobiales bacterium]